MNRKGKGRGSNNEFTEEQRRQMCEEIATRIIGGERQGVVCRDVGIEQSRYTAWKKVYPDIMERLGAEITPRNP